MTLSAASTARADVLWQALAEHQPGVAAALAMQLRDLPEDWAPRILGVARPHAALELPATADVPMEIEPYDAADWENCPACAELDQLCRYHEGYAAGYEALNGPLAEASRVDPTVTVRDALQRLADADEAAERGELAAVDRMTSTKNPRTTGTPVRALPPTSVPLTAREFFSVVDLSRPYIPEVDDPEEDGLDEEVHPAYTPTPSIPRLLAELVGEEFFTRYAAIRGDAEAFHPDYHAARQRAALLLRAVIADLVALADPANAHHAAQAAAAANAVRRADRWRPLPAPDARAWLRDQYQEYLEDDSSAHPPNCPGGCRGAGWNVEPVIWQDDGVPLHAEPVDCLRGETDDPHADDCLKCFGTGRRYDADRREYSPCFTYTPDPAYKPAPPSSTPAFDEPPF